jgi:hypothetical protein
VPCSASRVVPGAHRVVGPGTHRGSGPREVHTIEEDGATTDPGLDAEPLAASERVDDRRQCARPPGMTAHA